VIATRGGLKFLLAEFTGVELLPKTKVISGFPSEVRVQERPNAKEFDAEVENSLRIQPVFLERD